MVDIRLDLKVFKYIGCGVRVRDEDNSGVEKRRGENFSWSMQEVTACLLPRYVRRRSYRWHGSFPRHIKVSECYSVVCPVLSRLITVSCLLERSSCMGKIDLLISFSPVWIVLFIFLEPTV